MDKKTLIVGYGNPLRSDDGVGQAAAQILENEDVAEGVEVLSYHQLNIELAERLSTVDLAIFIDAEDGIQPGSVVVTKLESVTTAPSNITHHVDPGFLLAVSEKLFGRSPEAFLVTVGTTSMTLGEGLSETVAAALPEVVASVRRLVLEHLR